jgi:hypothetical protein
MPVPEGETGAIRAVHDAAVTRILTTSDFCHQGPVPGLGTPAGVVIASGMQAGRSAQWWPLAASQRSASSAAMQPMPAAVTAWR